MVRTAAGGARKAVGAKAPRKCAGGARSSTAGSSRPSTSAATSGGKRKFNTGGGNTPTQWDVPKWQKGIGKFFKKAVAEVAVTTARTTEHVIVDDVSTSDDVIITGEVIIAEDDERPGPSKRLKFDHPNCESSKKPGLSRQLSCSPMNMNDPRSPTMHPRSPMKHSKFAETYLKRDPSERSSSQCSTKTLDLNEMPETEPIPAERRSLASIFYDSEAGSGSEFECDGRE